MCIFQIFANQNNLSYPFVKDIKNGGNMKFDTYVKDRAASDISGVKNSLIAQILNADIETHQKSDLVDAVKHSGGSSLASRYGIHDTVTFADSELLNAYGHENSVAYLKYRYDFKFYPSNHKLKEFPLVVAVEASGICNLRCQMCFQKNMDRNKSDQNKHIMSWDTYQKFLNELDQNQLYSIVFASRGEPLLNPDISKMIKAAKAKGVLEIKLNTNATLLTEALSRELLDSGLDLIVFSVDSVVPEHYQQIRGTSLEKVLTNIDKFMQIKREEFPHSKMKVRVAMVLTLGMKENEEEEIRLAQEYWSDRVDEFSIKTENDFVSIYEDGQRAFEQSACSLLWERVYLWNDGSVNPCDIDHLSSMSLGNINQGKTIKEIWNGEKMQCLREHHLCSRGSLSTVCKNCVGY